MRSRSGRPRESDTAIEPTDETMPPAEALRLCQEARDRAESALAGVRAQLLELMQTLDRAQAREARYRRLAGRDLLTGLPNRLGFRRTMVRTLATHAPEGRGLCLLFIDLDGFKTVNDRLGHAAGDELLKVVGARLLHTVRQEDRVCRHGGDEFVCLLPQVGGEEQALLVAQKLIDTISAPCSLDGTLVRVRASAGIAMYPADGLTLPELLAGADRAMYWAKTRGAVLGLASATPLAGLGRTAGAANDLGTLVTINIPTSSQTIPAAAAPRRDGARPRA